MQITTPRLKLYEWNESHAQVLFDLNNDPEVIRYTGDPPFDSVEHALELIQNYPDYKVNGHGRWLCELKETGEIVGWCGLKRVNVREEEKQYNEISAWDESYGDDIEFVDLGYRFFHSHWGKGYATESGYASLKVGFEHFGLDEIIARALIENTGSIRVMEKLGLSFWKGAQCHNLPAEYYRISREEFRALKMPGIQSSEIRIQS